MGIDSFIGEIMRAVSGKKLCQHSRTKRVDLEEPSFIDGRMIWQHVRICMSCQKVVKVVTNEYPY